MPRGIPKSGINTGRFQKGRTPYIKKGSKRPVEYGERMSKIFKERGIRPPRKAIEKSALLSRGKPRTEEVRRKIGLSHLGLPSKVSGEKNYAWKGDKVSYIGLHKWVARWKGKPMLCEMCGSTDKKKYAWANIDHRYRRVLQDYIRLCYSCHAIYDYEKNSKKKKPKSKNK